MRHYGDFAAKLELRLSQLAVANNLEEMRSLGHTHELHENRKGLLAMDLTANWRLVFCPTEQPPPSRADGGLLWNEVTSVTILEVTDYHD